uniref:Solute carrier family 28 member 3 n=1 Tax=Nothobranchius furzeri TaxID=105023 RepID=A0A8C6MJ13_NOTFU
MSERVVMELNETHKQNEEQGTDNKAFEVEIHTEVDCASEDEENAHKNLNHRNKSLVEKKQDALLGYLAKYKDQSHLIVKLVWTTGLVAMVISACVLDFHRAVGLLVISLVAIVFLAWDWMMEWYGDWLWEVFSPVRDLLTRNWFWIRWMIYVLVLVAVVCWLALDTAQQGTRQLVSFSGLLLLVFLMLMFSKHPFVWCWQTLFCGIGLQFLFGLLTLRTSFGLSAVKWLSSQAEVMPILIFVSSVVSILYHIGFMPWLVGKIGFLMQVTMKTSPVESMAAAGNMFLGNTDTALLIRPYISELSISEIHAVMTGGFASISGAGLGVYISLGVDATHLLTASIMSAPASLAIAKMFWPEKETIVSISNQNLRLIKGESSNLLEAASQGASRAVGVVASIIANIIAFLALLAFFDSVLSWLGGMFDFPQLSFSLICSYIFMPLSFMMGVSWEDSFIVAELIGIKTFLNEFVAYQKLIQLIKKRTEGGPEYVNGVKQYISVHSEAIATYALCGFSNIASMGISIGAMSALAPNRQSDITSCSLRALVAGSVACFMTACIAGMLYIPDCPDFLNTEFNKTNVISSKRLLDCCAQLHHSVTMYGPWNVTIGGGFTESDLHGCCTLSAPKNLNCSSLI